MARWVQRHLLKSIIFCTTFFLALFIDNKNVVFFALGNSNDLPTLFFLFILLIHMQRALASRVTWNDEWLMFGCVVGLGEPQASAPLTTGSEFAIKHAYRWCHQTRDGPKIESRASMNRNCFFFEKNINEFTTFLNVKVHDAPKWMNWKKKEISLLLLAPRRQLFFQRTSDYNFTCSMYIKHKLSDSCPRRSFCCLVLLHQ